jgi:TPP-dependent indolepyruvate ferredoxin oxidoreductase alpha subunit
MNMAGAQAMAKILQHEGVRVVFGYPGAAVCPFLDEIYGIVLRQSQGAAGPVYLKFAQNLPFIFTAIRNHGLLLEK